MPQEKSINILLNFNLNIIAAKPLFLLVLLSGCQPVGQVPEQRWQHAIEGAYAANISNDAKYSVVSSIHHGISLWNLETNALKYSWSQQQDSADNLV